MNEEKARRMELRKQNGTRGYGRDSPLPKGPAYLVAHACFSCRRTSKVASRDDELACPECGGTYYYMGRTFRAPKKRDDEQWRKVQRLYAYGFRFFGTGREPALPERLNEVDQFVVENPDHPLRIGDLDNDLLV